MDKSIQKQAHPDMRKKVLGNEKIKFLMENFIIFLALNESRIDTRKLLLSK